MAQILWNERAWSGQLISWIKSAIENHTTIFQDATNDSSLKVESGRTKFPDILLFSDKTSGIIFNGWELKFPDTAVDDATMLDNALEKAKRLKSDSFVTWNGAEAIIWGIDTEHYTVGTLTRIKEYPKVATINSREDLSDYNNYLKHEPILQAQLAEILHDLEQLYINGEIRPAINISGNIIESVRKTSEVVIPQFRSAIINAKRGNRVFRKEYDKWKIYESSTLKILETSSRRSEIVDADEVLAKFTFYNLVGKTLFYLTLCENMSGKLDRIICDDSNVKQCLNSYFDKAKAIDFQAIFQPYFTDDIEYSQVTNTALWGLIQVLAEFDFHILPSQVIGHILENLVPSDEKQKFGQYFTPEILANLVAFPAVQSRNDILLDPTSGTGTFLNSFYQILKFMGKEVHTELLSQIWGNDVSHFPAILSVINLYKQNVTQVDNFPRVMRDDFFNLKLGKLVDFPDSKDYSKHLNIPIPQFDGIASNFPFIQQEDIPNEALTCYFREAFEKEQRSFLKDETFSINERSDYFTYCVYQSYRFLKEHGMLSCITSNAWLGKEYGIQFKKFLLDNFHIKYIVKSNAEHWFTDSAVSTIYFVLEKKKSEESTRFITINQKLSSLWGQKDINSQLSEIEDFYRQIDFCDNEHNTDWSVDNTFSDLYKSNNGNFTCCIVPKQRLIQSLQTGDNWSTFFLSAHIFESFDQSLVQYSPNIVKVIRGERTGWNPMFIIPQKDIVASGISEEYLVPYIKSSTELSRVVFRGNYKNKAFVCLKSIDNLDNGTRNWINSFVNKLNKNHSATIPEACATHKPYWYSINPKQAHIITAINPYKRFFFTYSDVPFTVDQRLIGLQVQGNYSVELIAALLNSAITFLTLELRGTSRNLGALDLNANYLKQLRILNPDLLSEKSKEEIITAFQDLKNRDIEDFTEEIKLQDRKNLDETIFKAYGFDISILPTIYELLSSSINERVTMKEK